MTQEERYSVRDLSYSAWHRRQSTRRYVGIEKAQLLAMIDLDVPMWVEYDNDTKEPVVLVEVAQDVGQSNKPSTVTRKLGERAGVPCFVALYTLADTNNPAAPEYKDIASFRVKRLWPNPQNEWNTLTPSEWAEKLLAARSWKAGRLDGQNE